MKFAAKVLDSRRWVAEFRIPLASSGIKPDASISYPLNVAVSKQGDGA